MHKILIVDDDQIFLTLFTSLLADRGYIIETVQDAIEAFSIIETFKPDLIVLDTFIKEYDGRTIGKMLKLTESTSHIPVILCSVNPDIGNTSYQQYADLFLIKPLKLDDLLKAFKDLIKD